MLHPEVAKARAELAALSRPDAGDDDRRAAARQRLVDAKVVAFVEKALESAPPLSNETRSRLCELLRPVRITGGRDA